MPRLSDPLRRATIGAAVPLPGSSPPSSSSSSSSSSPSPSPSNHSLPFLGQLGPLYLFNDSLSERQVAAIHSLGPTHGHCFQRTDLALLPGRHGSDVVGLFEGREAVGDKVALHYSAQAVRPGTVTVPNTAQVEQGGAEGLSSVAGMGLLSRTAPVLPAGPQAGSSGASSLDAVLLSGVQACTRSRLQDALACIGGVSAILPLFTVLDLPRGTREREEGVDEEEEQQLGVYIVHLLTEMVGGSAASREWVSARGGIGILNFLLQRVSPRHLTVSFVLALDRMVVCLGEQEGER